MWIGYGWNDDSFSQIKKNIPFFVKNFLLFYCLINKFNKVQVTNSLKGKKDLPY